MDTLKDLLQRRGSPEPEESRLIKAYVQQHFQSVVGVVVQPRQIIINAPNAALAGTLRLQGQQLTAACRTEKRLLIRIS